MEKLILGVAGFPEVIATDQCHSGNIPMQSGSSPGSTRDAPNAAVLVSIAGSKPTAFEAVSFQQVLGQDVARPLRRLSGCRARTLAGTCCTVETSVPMSGDAARKGARATYFRRLSVAAHPTGF